VQVIVVANGCSDGTVAEARALTPAFAERGWRLDVLDLTQGSKIAALNAGDRAAVHDKLAYIDADIRVAPGLIAELVAVLDRPDPAYASGRPQVPRAKSFLSERYARFWEKLPFITTGVPGCGVYAVNAAGRARWANFPEIISDDTFVRLHFAPEERHGVPSTFQWPITEGFVRLVRVRRRQNHGLEEVQRLYPDLVGQKETTAPGGQEKLRLFVKDPLGFVIYAAVALTVRLPVLNNRGGWDRGR
jgi:glycosyltransferase involved in cell wall biosynthesis